MVKSHEPSATAEGERASVAQPSPLGAWLCAALDAPKPRATFRQLFEREIARCAVGLPRWVRATELQSYLRPSDALVELAQSPLVGPFDAAVALASEHATLLVELVLGGAANSGVASLSGCLSDAECGVLAYAAARLCAVHEGGWRVRDVRGARQLALTERCLLWPIALHSSAGVLDCTLLLSEALASTLDQRLELELTVRDACSEQTLNELAPADVLVSDRWLLTHTTEGLSGDLTGTVTGSDSELLLRLAGGQIESRGLVRGAREGQLEVVIGRVCCSFVELAELASGGALPMPRGQQAALLRRAGRPLATGELIAYRGAVGVRVLELLTAPE